MRSMKLDVPKGPGEKRYKSTLQLVHKLELAVRASRPYLKCQYGPLALTCSLSSTQYGPAARTCSLSSIQYGPPALTCSLSTGLRLMLPV